MPKRYRVRRNVKPGELCMYWGVEQHNANSPDLMVHSKAPAKRADAGMLIYAFERDLRKELEARGYDVTTLKFSIMKKEISAP